MDIEIRLTALYKPGKMVRVDRYYDIIAKSVLWVFHVCAIDERPDWEEESMMTLHHFLN